jgi:hypothetical protein
MATLRSRLLEKPLMMSELPASIQDFFGIRIAPDMEMVDAVLPAVVSSEPTAELPPPAAAIDARVPAELLQRYL